MGHHIVIELCVEPSLHQFDVLRRDARRRKQAKDLGKAPERVKVRTLAGGITLSTHSPNDVKNRFGKLNIIVLARNLCAGDQIIKALPVRNAIGAFSVDLHWGGILLRAEQAGIDEGLEEVKELRTLQEQV